MNTKVAFENCLSYIDSQMQATEKTEPLPAEDHGRPAITISRETGAGAITVGEKLAEYLQAHSPAGPCPWTVFDKNLVEKVLEDHDLPKRLARFMPEDRCPQIEDIMAEVLGLRPPSWTLVHQTVETMLRLAQMGRVILVGRAACVITHKLKNVFHVRLVASWDKRVAHIQQIHHFDAAAAADFVRKSDQGRKRYVQTYFNQHIDNPLLYHMILNTDLVPFDAAARIIGDAVLRRLAAGAPVATEAIPA
jgi:cytidylate kinase